MSVALARDAWLAALGPVRSPGPLRARVEGEAACDGYTRRHVTYDVPSGRAGAFVCVPDHYAVPVPVVFCHHQHANRFDLGKSEVCGLQGDPDQAYAAKLAQRGLVTIAPDAIGFEDRNWAGGRDVSWFELSSRLVLGRTLLADCLQEISLALDYATALPEVDPARVGFIGHSYGGRAALWAPAWDPRIRVSVSNCGCIPYRNSFTRDTGVQAEYVVPGFVTEHDIDDVVALATHCNFLIMAAEGDRWSRGADWLRQRWDAGQQTHIQLETRIGGHEFPPAARGRAYRFLADHLDTTDRRPPTSRARPPRKGV